MVNKTLKKLEVPFGLGFSSIGINLVGSKLGEQLPPGTPNPLTSIGTSAATAAGITGKIIFAGIALEEVRKLKPKDNKSKLKKFEIPNVQLVRDYGKKQPL